MSESQFIHLHVHSAYSLAEGAIRVKDLVKLCKKNDMPAVAVTDTNNLFGALEFAMAAADDGVQPIIGAQVQVEDSSQLVLLVQDEEGYKNLCRLVSAAFLESDGHSDPYIKWEDLKGAGEGLICLSGGVKGPVAQSLLHNRAEEAQTRLEFLKGVFGDRFYIELQRHGDADEDRIEEALIDMAYAGEIPLVATNDCYFADKKMHEAHDALLCIAEGRYISESDRRRVTPDHYFKNPAEIIELFKDLPEAVHNTVQIARRCHYLLKPIDPILPPFDTESGRSEIEELRAQSEQGLNLRLENFVFTPGMSEAEREEMAAPYRERLDYELGIITQMGFPGYFLIVSDFIKWAKGEDIPVGPGRGSGAGSVVAWALKITDLDPLRFNLLFERFLNPERVSMPDFDVDFCQDRRDEVITYVQEKYGYDKVAQIITFGKLQARAVVRDVGRVLQMPYGQVDRIAKMIPNNPAAPTTLEEALEQDPDLRAERYKDETSDKLITIALQLEGLYRHASTHAAGVVIGDRPLHELVPLYRDPRSDMPVTQFNMKYVEQAGLVKFDFLGLKTLTVIQKAIDLVAEQHSLNGQGAQEKIDILQIPFDDRQTYDLLAGGNTTGVFQLESAGMRDVLKKVKPNRFEDIIALVSLYRPGPMDNIPRYIATKEGHEAPDYLHPSLKPILEETFGIMIYQEQVMQAAQYLAGYTLGGADLLRRAMGKKIQSAMDAEREKFIAGANDNDVGADQASAIFDQIAKFAGYGFNKSHAAAYALIAYQTAWLKANYPVEFMAASMTLDMGNTDKLSVFKQGLDRMGIELRGPDINYSGVEFRVEKGTIRYALAALKGVGEQAMQVLVDERAQNGPYKDVADFAGRLDPKSMNRRQFEQMAAAGAFESINDNRARMYSGAEAVLAQAASMAQERETGQNSLFGGEDTADFNMPALPDIPDWDPLEKLRYEFDAVGFYLSAHPLDTKKAQLERTGIVMQADVVDALRDKNSSRIKMAGVLIKKQEKVSPKSGNKYAFLQLSDSSGVYEVVLFAEVLNRTRAILEPGATLLLSVDAEQREDQIRFTMQDVHLLDQALETSISEVHLHMNGAGDAASVRDLLEPEKGRGRASLFVHVAADPYGLVKISIPGRYLFTAETRNTLFQSGCVGHIDEV